MLRRLLRATAGDSRKVLKGDLCKYIPEKRKRKLILRMDDPNKKKSLKALSVLCLHVTIYALLTGCRCKTYECNSLMEGWSFVVRGEIRVAVNLETDYNIESKIDLFIHNKHFIQIATSKS
jgi:hypothetical protein